MTHTTNRKAGLDALLTPDNSVLILIDHQPFQFAGLRSHDTQTVINNVVGLAKSAKVFGVPTLLTTVVEERGGHLHQAASRHLPPAEADRPHCHQYLGRRTCRRMGEEDGPEENRDGRAVD